MQFPSVSRPVWIAIAILYACFFLGILILAYTGNLPAFLTQNDKLGHLVLYCTATFLGHIVLRHRHVCWFQRKLPLFPLLFALFTVAEEATQGLSVNRSLDAIDLVASLVGIGVGYGLAEWQRSSPN